MNKKNLFFFFFLLLLFIGAIRYTPTLQTPFLQFFNFIKASYLDSVTYIQEAYTRHINQAATILQLQEELKEYKKTKLKLQELEKKYNELTHLVLKNDIKNVSLVRAIGYERFGDTNRLWLDVKDYNSSKIYGLLYKDIVAGIVIAKDNLPLALLNKDPKSAYAVMIGNENAPGIAHGNNDATIVVTYIPAWYNIQIGDEVVTSGLDNIFFKGSKVGKVIEISTSQGYKKAIVKPYFTQSTLQYYYMIKR